MSPGTPPLRPRSGRGLARSGWPCRRLRAWQPARRPPAALPKKRPMPPDGRAATPRPPACFRMKSARRPAPAATIQEHHRHRSARSKPKKAEDARDARLPPARQARSAHTGAPSVREARHADAVLEGMIRAIDAGGQIRKVGTATRQRSTGAGRTGQRRIMAPLCARGAYRSAARALKARSLPPPSKPRRPRCPCPPSGSSTEPCSAAPRYGNRRTAIP